MDTNVEFEMFETEKEVSMQCVAPLTDLQLALVGGGCGDVIFA